jgi:hypothetical protein
MRSVVVDDEEGEFDGNVVSSIGDQARSILAVSRTCGVTPRPSFGTTVGGVRAREALISDRVGGSLQRLLDAQSRPGRIHAAHVRWRDRRSP